MIGFKSSILCYVFSFVERQIWKKSIFNHLKGDVMRVSFSVWGGGITILGYFAMIKVCLFTKKQIEKQEKCYLRGEKFSSVDWSHPSIPHIYLPPIRFTALYV